MKKLTSIYTLLIFVLISQSCKKDEDKVTPQSEWESIEFADQGAIHSIYGSLEENLLIGTGLSIIKISDNGKSSKQVLQVKTQISTFLKDADTLYAISNFQDYYSVDNGDSWQESSRNFMPFNRINDSELRDSKGILYHHVAIPNGELITPSLILRSSDNGTNWTNIFPYKRYVFSTYLDDKDRLYIGTINWEWEGVGFSGTGNTAILYYQKK
jgi:hypothetical protein